MSVSKDDVRHIAALARLSVPESRLPAMVEELNSILAHMDVLQKVDLTALQNADSSSSPTSGASALRADVAQSVVLAHARETFAPEMRDGFFLVPRLATHGNTAGGASAATDGPDDEL